MRPVLLKRYIIFQFQNYKQVYNYFFLMSNLSSGQRQRLKNSTYHPTKHSYSPTLSSSRSERSYWARSYKNQPIPAEIRRRLIGKKNNFSQDSGSEEGVLAVLEEEEQQQIEKKRKILPRFKVMSDEGQFSDFRHSRIHSERKRLYSPQKCRSVESLKLPQVVEQKKEDDELKNLELSKLAEFKDRNQFGQKPLRRSSSEYTEVVSKVESTEGISQFAKIVPQQIIQNDAEETKSVKLPNEKSIITTQIQKLIVDELDQIKKRKESEIQNIESIIQEKIQDQENIDTDKLRQSLSKFESESEYLTNMNDEYQTKNEKIQEIESIKESSSQKQQ